MPHGSFLRGKTFLSFVPPVDLVSLFIPSVCASKLTYQRMVLPLGQGVIAAAGSAALWSLALEGSSKPLDKL